MLLAPFNRAQGRPVMRTIASSGAILRTGANWAFWVWLVATAATLGIFATLWILGWQVDIVRSASMQPAIPRDSVALIAPIAPGSVRDGDVIRFRLSDDGDERLVLHRVVSVEAADGGLLIFRTQGDANSSPDPRAVYGEQVEGRLVFHIPWLGGVVDLFRQPVGLALLVGLPIAVGLMAEAYGRIRQRKRA